MPVYVAEADSAVAGFFLLRGAAPDGELQAMFVDPPWISQGLASGSIPGRVLPQLVFEIDLGTAS